jgi:hypothetical protein
MGNYAGYWKNSQFIPVDMSANNSYAIDMAFSGKDIYVHLITATGRFMERIPV